MLLGCTVRGVLRDLNVSYGEQLQEGAQIPETINPPIADPPTASHTVKEHDTNPPKCPLTKDQDSSCSHDMIEGKTTKEERSSAPLGSSQGTIDSKEDEKPSAKCDKQKKLPSQDADKAKPCSKSQTDVRITWYEDQDSKLVYTPEHDILPGNEPTLCYGTTDSPTPLHSKRQSHYAREVIASDANSVNSSISMICNSPDSFHGSYNDTLHSNRRQSNYAREVIASDADSVNPSLSMICHPPDSFHDSFYDSGQQVFPQLVFHSGEPAHHSEGRGSLESLATVQQYLTSRNPINPIHERQGMCPRCDYLDRQPILLRQCQCVNEEASNSAMT